VRIDLHTHSAASDGTDTPAELVANAARAGLDVVALTDHDTTSGWQEAADTRPAGLTLVPGAEFSCRCPDGRGGECTVHLLGYLFDPTADAITGEQARLRADRRRRLHAMAERMRDDGYPIDPGALLGAVPPDASAGRPHLARALAAAGAVGSVDEAFRTLLGSGCRYYMPKEETPVERAIEMIHAAGGVSVLAHAFAGRRGPTVTASVVRKLAEVGLAGLEVAHPDHDRQARDELRELAGELGLVGTGSSDYHGGNKVNQLGQDTTEQASFEELATRASGREPLAG
jgi:predicted metal-dependent phosphoesterase TrpH